MSVLRQDIDSVNAVLTVKLGKEDYQEKVDKALKDLRKKANIPGFRPGNVPIGLVKKMYGKSVMAEQINRLISENLYTYIQDNKLSILGEPLPAAQDEEKKIDFEKDEEFEFSFEIGLAPEFNVELTADDKVKYYNIEVTDEMIEKQVKSYRSRTGKQETVEGPSIEGDMLRGDLVELKEEGLKLESIVLLPSYMSNDDEKAKFNALTVGQEITFNIANAYNGNEQEIRYLLHLGKDADVSGYTSDFTFKVTEISRFVEGELNQELFDSVMGKDVVKSEEEFRAKVKEGLAMQLTPEADYKFLFDTRKLLLDKAGQLTFPDAFLKRFMLLNNEKATAESVEAEYAQTIEGLTWHLIKEKFVKENNLSLEKEEVSGFAKKVARTQFAQYGMVNAPEDVVANYAESLMKDAKTKNNIVDRALDEKLIVLFKGKVTLENENVSMEEFTKFFESENEVKQD